MRDVEPLWFGSRKIVGDFNHVNLMDEIVLMQKSKDATFFRITIDKEQKIIWCGGWNTSVMSSSEEELHNPLGNEPIAKENATKELAKDVFQQFNVLLNSDVLQDFIGRNWKRIRVLAHATHEVYENDPRRKLERAERDELVRLKKKYE